MDLSYMRVAYATLLFIFVFCGALRSLDLWKPLGGKNADELYPARRTVACIYFSGVLLLPCVLHPYSGDAQLLARCFWILFVPAATALGYKRFFYGDSRHRRLRVALVGGVPLAFTLALSCIAMAGGDMLMIHRKTVIHAAGILGALLTAYGIHVMIWLWHIRSGADTVARSSDRLFPTRFASGMLLMSSSVLVATWSIFLFGDMRANTLFAGIIAFVGLGVLFVILHPQRVENQDCDGTREAIISPDGSTLKVSISSETDDNPEHTDTCLPEDEYAENEETEDEYVTDGIMRESARPIEKKHTLSDAQLDSMERQIRRLVEGRRMYLDSRLTQKTLEKELGVNHFYLSEAFARRFGSFNLYLNTLRMEQTIRYAAEHPGAKQMEVLHHSGFGSDNSYYRAKRIYWAKKTLSDNT